jgi:hypothetical protein
MQQLLRLFLFPYASKATFPVLPVNEIRYKSVVFYYSPNTSATTDVMSRVRRVPMFVSVPELHFIGVNSEKEIIERIGSSNLSLNHDVYFPDLHIYGGIVFPPHLHHEDDDIVVTIREKQEVNILHTWHTSSQQEDNTVFYPKEYRTYFNYGFLSIQSALATAITEWKLESNGVKVNPDMIPRIRTKVIVHELHTRAKCVHVIVKVHIMCLFHVSTLLCNVYIMLSLLQCV